MDSDASEATEAGFDPEVTGRAAAEAGAVSARRAFLAHLRHELRTPINAILGYSEMLIEDAEDAGGTASVPDLEKIQGAGRQLLELVNGILDPSRIERDSALDIAEFEAQLRHDLRVPLNTVIGYSELLIENAQDESAHEVAADLQKIRTAGERLTELIGDVVRLSRADEGTSLAGVPSEASEVARDAITSMVGFEEAAPAPVEAGGRILVVDDTATNRDLLQRRLTREGFTVSLAEHGRQALECLAAGAFDLVLLDVMMPELNGYEVLRRMKADPRLRHLPVIMISALDELDSVVRCIEMGAEDYLPKPFNPVLLRARIHSSMEKKRLRDREQAYLEELAFERERSERLLLNVLPQPIAERLKRGETEIADSFPDVSVLFADLVDFTEISARLTPAELVRRLNVIFSAFDKLAERHGLEKVKTIGDAYLVVGGLPTPRPDHAQAVAAMALDMIAVAERLASESGDPFRVRIGIHSGPVVAGVIGTKKFTYDLWGDTVNTASRMESHGIPGAIHVSEATYLRITESFRLEERGPILVKGKGRLRTYLLRDRLSEVTPAPPGR